LQVPPLQQEIKPKKTIYEKADIILKLKMITDRKCKFDLECHSYKCQFIHSTAKMYSPEAMRILELIIKFNASNEEEKK
jgi:hypothetical protein